MPELTPRQKAELAIMGWLNDNQFYGANSVYDFGELGILHIYWNHNWVCRWYQVRTPPAVVLEKLSIED